MTKDKLEHNAAATKRWRSRLKRAMSMLDKLERQRKRLETKAVKLTENIGSTTWTKPATTIADIDPPNHADQLAGYHPDQSAAERKRRTGGAADDLAIPGFLKRPASGLDATRQRSIDTDADKAEQIKAEQEAAKKAKAKGRIEKMKAKQRGDLKKMPLTGRAALAAINQ